MQPLAPEGRLKVCQHRLWLHVARNRHDDVANIVANLSQRLIYRLGKAVMLFMRPALPYQYATVNHLFKIAL